MRFLAIILLLLGGCSMSGEPEQSTKMMDAEQSLLIAELKADGIPFRLDEQGAVWYRISLEGRVGAAQVRVLNRTRPLYAVSFDKQSEADRLGAALTEKNVVTKRWTDLGQHWVQWNEKDEKTVSEVEFALNKKALQERYNK